MKTKEEIVRDNNVLAYSTEAGMSFINIDHLYNAMEEYAQERTKDMTEKLDDCFVQIHSMFEREFVEWCIQNTAKCYPKGQYVEIEDNKEFKTLDELYQHWKENINIVTTHDLKEIDKAKDERQN